MAGWFALDTEVLGGFDEAGAEEFLPEAVDGDAGTDRIEILVMLDAIHFAKARRVPQLGREIAVGLDPRSAQQSRDRSIDKERICAIRIILKKTAKSTKLAVW